MVQTINKARNYQSYIRNVLRMYAFMDAGKFDTDEADVVREQMVDPWYELSQAERKRMDGLVMDLDDLWESQKSNIPIQLTEQEYNQSLGALRKVVGLKEAGEFDPALELLRDWKGKMARHFLWHFRGSIWTSMEVPEIAVQFYREATRLEPIP